MTLTNLGLARLALGRQLLSRAYACLKAYPDANEMARKAARDIAHTLTGKWLDPDRIWWHRFSHASSAATYTGWRHAGPPVESCTLTELMLRRFSPHFQEASDELDQMAGFYLQGPQAERFGAHNEVPMSGQAVQSQLWSLDFANLYQGCVERFWQDHQGDFEQLCRLQVLAAAVRSGLGASDVGLLRQALLGGATAVPDIHRLARRPAWQASTLHLGGTEAAGCAVVTVEGRVFLYRPTVVPEIRAFDSQPALLAWLDGEPPAQQGRSGCVALATDLFGHWAAQSQAQMLEHARIMVSNADLREAMWRGYLGAFLQVFGPMAPLSWPLGLLLIGASAARLELDIEEVTHTASPSCRRQALFETIADGLYLLLGLADLGVSVQELRYRPALHEQLPPTGWSPTPTPDLAGLQGSAAEASPAEDVGLLGGVLLDGTGGTWAAIDGVHYRIRYSESMDCWLVVLPENPFAFTEVHPLRRNAEGGWEVLAPARLAGGMDTLPPAGLRQEASALWDTYLNLGTLQRLQLSTEALSRQAALLDQANIAYLAPATEAPVDNGLRYALQADGQRTYTFRHGDHYYNDYIEAYTDEECALNDFFRQGVQDIGHTDNLAFIQRFADSVEALPRDPAVTLYRGGRTSRGTSGEHFRSGQYVPGDILVNTDVSSFSESPAVASEFMSTYNPDGNRVFDDSSVLFELPAGHYENAAPVARFSASEYEAESVFLPGHYFRIDDIAEVVGEGYRFVRVRLSEVAGPGPGVVRDLRTGEAFDREAYAAMLGQPSVVQRFFPQA